MKDNDFNLELLAIKEFIKEYYDGKISEEKLNELATAINENYKINSKEDVFKVLKEAEGQNSVEEVNQQGDNSDVTLEEQAQQPVEEQIVKENEDIQKVENKSESIPENKSEKKSKKKKVIIIVSIICALLIVGAILFFVFIKKEDTPKEEKKQTKITWKTVLNSAAVDGTLVKMIIDKTDDDEVNAMIMDIDSDETLELVISTDEKNKSKLIVYEMDDEVEYSKEYIANDNELVYTYNMINENFYWAINNEESKTVIAINDKVLTEEDFSANYYIVTNKYKNNDLFDNSVEIKLDKETKDISKEIKKAIDNKFTNDELIEDNKITKKKIQEQIDEQKAVEEEAKKKEEEEKKKAEEEKKAEEQKQKTTSTEIVNYSGNDVKLEVIINKMPEVIEDESNSKNTSTYAYVKFSNSFITNNIVTSIEYLYASNKYNNANVDNIKNNEIRINDIYVNSSNETSVIVTFKNKDNQTKKYKITSVGQVVE